MKTNKFSQISLWQDKINIELEIMIYVSDNFSDV